MSASRSGQRRMIDREQRRAKVAELLLCGHSRVSIAATLGVAPATVTRDVEAVRAEWRERANRSTAKWLAERLADLSALRRTFLPLALPGDPRAAEVVLKIGSQVDDLLGTRQPGQIVLTQDLVSAEIARLELELGLSEPPRELGPGS